MAYDVDKMIDKIMDAGDLEFADVVDFIRFYNPFFSITESRSADMTPDLLLYKGRQVMFQVMANDNETTEGFTNSYTEPSERAKDNKPVVTGGGNSVQIDQFYDEYNLILPGERPTFLFNFRDIERVVVVEDHNELAKVNPRLYSFLLVKGNDTQKEFLDKLDPVMIYIILKKQTDKTNLGVRRTDFEGYAVSPEFYAPKYPPGEPVLESDYRRTLYWNPELVLDKEGKARIQFYNNNSCKQLMFSAEGITGDGKLLLYNP